MCHSLMGFFALWCKFNLSNFLFWCLYFTSFLKWFRVYRRKLIEECIWKEGLVDWFLNNQFSDRTYSIENYFMEGVSRISIAYFINKWIIYTYSFLVESDCLDLYKVVGQRNNRRRIRGKRKERPILIPFEYNEIFY